MLCIEESCLPETDFDFDRSRLADYPSASTRSSNAFGVINQNFISHKMNIEERYRIKLKKSKLSPPSPPLPPSRISSGIVSTTFKTTPPKTMSRSRSSSILLATKKFVFHSASTFLPIPHYRRALLLSQILLLSLLLLLLLPFVVVEARSDEHRALEATESKSPSVTSSVVNPAGTVAPTPTPINITTTINVQSSSSSSSSSSSPSSFASRSHHPLNSPPLHQHHHFASHFNIFPYTASAAPISSAKSFISTMSSTKSSAFRLPLDDIDARNKAKISNSNSSSNSSNNIFFGGKNRRKSNFKNNNNNNNKSNSSSSSSSSSSNSNSSRWYSRKRKRELFALTIADDIAPQSSPVPPVASKSARFWSSKRIGRSGTTIRARRLAGRIGRDASSSASVSSSSSSSSLSSFVSSHSYHGLSGGDRKLSLKQSPLSSSPFASINSINSVNTAAAINNMRMKIMLNPPPGFVAPGLIPDAKCNFELYPSGCFDENGSICDGSGSGVCVCRPGYTIRIGQIYCLRPKAIGEACYTTEQCERKVTHSGCFNYREEYREENPSAFFGPSQSSWPTGECRCRLGHRYDPNVKSCVRSLIGSWCSNVWDCDMVEEEDHQDIGHDRESWHGQSSSSSSSTSSSSHHHGSNRNSAHSGSTHRGHNQSGIPPIMHWHNVGIASSAAGGSGRAKLANIVCERNTCNCSQFFHYNETMQQCQFAETYGEMCRPSASPSASLLPSASAYAYAKSGQRNIRSSSLSSSTSSSSSSSSSASSSPLSSSSSSSSSSANMATINDRDGSHRSMIAYIGRQLKSIDDFVVCNLPTVCSENGTCVCLEGFEHQPTTTPQCQPLSHYLYSGTSGRSGAKGGSGDGGTGGGGFFDRDTRAHFEGQSNMANFFEYVLYMMVPALIVIIMFKPCFRRIGQWRNHIHQYQSDSDFYLSGNGLPGSVLGDVNVIAPGAGIGTGAAGVSVAEKTLPSQYASPYSAFGPHLSCHNAYIFESADGCYAYGAGCLSPSPAAAAMPGTRGGLAGVAAAAAAGQNASLEIVREKLGTIEEAQSEEAIAANFCPNCVGPATDSTNPLNRMACCANTVSAGAMSESIDASNNNNNNNNNSGEDAKLMTNNLSNRLTEHENEGIELMKLGSNGNKSSSNNDNDVNRAEDDCARIGSSNRNNDSFAAAAAAADDDANEYMEPIHSINSDTNL